MTKVYCKLCNTQLSSKRTFCNNKCSSIYHNSLNSDKIKAGKIKIPQYNCDFSKYDSLLDELGYEKVKKSDFRSWKREQR